MTPADIRDDEAALRYVLGAGLDLEAAATRAPTASACWSGRRPTLV